jgi:hypothetical protein
MENAIKTDNAIKQALAVFLAPIAILGLVFSISTTSFTASAIADGTTQQGTSGDVDLSVQSTRIEMEVRPWCGWTALAASSDVITLAPTDDVVYDGTLINLVATGVLFAIKVGPATDDTAVPQPFAAEEADECSWFATDQKNGVAVSTTLSGNVFAAVSDANLGGATTDDTMSFSAEEGNPLTIDNTATSDCDIDEETGFNFEGSPFIVSDNSVLTKAVVSMTAQNTETNNFCSWTSDYAISIPAGKKPLFGDSTYTYTGPTVTNTMVYSRP